MNNGIAVLGAGIVFGAGIAVGAALFHQEAVPRSSTSPAPQAAGKPAPSDRSALDEIRSELAKLSGAVADLRRESSGTAITAPSPPDPGSPRTAGGDEWKSVTGEGGTVAFSMGGGDLAEHVSRMRKRQLAKTGLPESQQDGIEGQLAAERAAIQDRFRAELDPGAWEEYRTLLAKGWHRQTDPDRAKIQAMESRFKTLQEQVLRQWADAPAYGALSGKQRDVVESMRGGHLAVGPDGNPAVTDAQGMETLSLTVK